MKVVVGSNSSAIANNVTSAIKSSHYEAYCFQLCAVLNVL